MINISVADNQPVVMQGIKCFFNNHPIISISDSIFHLNDVEESLKCKLVSVLVIDIELAGLHNVNSLKRIIEGNPTTKLLVYTCASEKLFGITALKAGAAGFISKNEPLKNIEEAILKIAAGNTFFSDTIHKSVLVSARLNNDKTTFRKLSTREIEVLQHLVLGKKCDEISELMSLNEKTISTYKLRLFNKLYVSNLIDLVNKAKTLQIV